MIFLLLQDVVNAIKMSLLLAIASICFEKIYLYPKSLAIELITEVSVVRAKALKCFLFF